MSWKYYYIVMRETKEDGSTREYPLLRYGEGLIDALRHAYDGIDGWEPVFAREATEFEIEGYGTAFKM